MRDGSRLSDCPSCRTCTARTPTSSRRVSPATAYASMHRERGVELREAEPDPAGRRARRGAPRARACRLPCRRERGRYDQQRARCPPSDERVVVGGQQRVHRHRNDAGADRTEETDGKVDAVFETQQYALLASVSPRARKQVREPIRAADRSPRTCTSRRRRSPRCVIRAPRRDSAQQLVGGVVAFDRNVVHGVDARRTYSKSPGLPPTPLHRRRDPRRELARRRARLHQRRHVFEIRCRRQPFVAALCPRRLVDDRRRSASPTVLRSRHCCDGTRDAAARVRSRCRLGR